MPSKALVAIKKRGLGAITWISSSTYLNRDALPFKTHLFVSPLGVFAGIRFEHSISEPEFAIDVLIGFISFISMVLFLWIIWLLFYRRDKQGKKLNIFLVLIGLIAGGARGALTELLAAGYFETPINFEVLIQRFCTSGVAWAFALPVFAHVTSGIREFRKLRDKSLATLLDQERTRSALIEKTLQPSTSFKCEVEKLLSETFGPLLATILENKDLPAAAKLDEVLDRLLKVTSSRVREISHDIADARVRISGKVSAARLIRESLFYNQINLPTTMIIVLVTNFFSPLFKAGILAAVSQAVFGGTVAISLLLTIRRISKESKSAGLNVFFASLAYGGIHSWLQLNVYQAEVSAQQQQSFGSLFILNFLVLFLALVISGLQKSSTLAGDELMTKLDASIDRSRLETHLLEDLGRQDAQALSEYLHGYLQSQLMAISIQLSEARASGDEVQINKLLDHVRSLANDPLSKFDPGTKSNLEDGLRALAVTWAGILHIDFRSKCEVDALPVLDQVLALQVIEEAISNSYRHGNATIVKVSVEADEGSDICVMVADNGSGVAITKPGLGTDNFGRISAGNWSLLNNQPGPGVTLTLQITRITK